MRYHFRLPLFLILAAGFQTGCGSPLANFSHQGYVNLYGAWYGPNPIDLALVNPLLQTYDGITQKTYSDYRMAGNANTAYLVGTFYDSGTAKFRAVGETYSQFSLNGNGWQVLNPSSYFISTAAGSMTDLSVGWLSSGDLLSAFTDGTVNVQSGVIDITTNPATWQHFTNSVTPIFPDSAHPPNGYATSIAGNTGGNGYLTYVDSNFDAYLQRYVSFTGWDTGTAGIRIGGGAIQVESLYDGLGFRTFYLGESLTVTQIATGGYHACALISNGDVICWGDNFFDQSRGDGSAAPKQATPFLIPLGGPAIQITAGHFHSCALLKTGLVKCWGDNTSGQSSGDGTTVSAATPLSVNLGAGVKAISISAGNSHTCAVTNSNSVECWGSNNFSQVNPGGAAGTTAVTAIPLGVTGGALAASVSAGAYFTCALTSTSNVKCWGKNDFGQANGNGSTVSPQTTVNLVNLGGAAVNQISTGAHHTCAIEGTGVLACWGDNTYGQTTGNGTTSGAQATVVTVPLAFKPIQLTLGAYHTCVISTTMAVYCWGKNDVGEIGDGTTTSPRTSPTLSLMPTGLNASAVSGGGDEGSTLPGFTCMITNINSVLCWGDNSQDQIGNVAIAGANEPTPSGVMLTEQTPLAKCSNCRVTAIENTSGLYQAAVLSSGDTKAFAVAADGSGDVASIFIQANPGAPACSNTTIPPTVNCNYRVFANVKTTAGTWSGPTQLDDGFSQSTTSLYQNSAGAGGGTAEGGIDYFTPGIAYVGNGRFLATFVITDNVSRMSSIYVRGYTVGSGWDSSAMPLEQMSLSGTNDQIRLANDLRFVGDSQGDAVLVAHYVVSSNISSILTRNYGYKAYQFIQGSWQPPNTFAGGQTCLANAICWNLKPAVQIFPGGETTLVVPVPNPSSSTQLQLVEFNFH